MKTLHACRYLCAAVLALSFAGAAIGEDRGENDRTLFFARYDSRLSADFARGEGALVSGGAGLASDERFGRVLKASGEGFLGLEYSSGGHFSNEEGTIEFWFNPFFPRKEDDGTLIHRIFSSFAEGGSVGVGVNTNAAGGRHLWFITINDQTPANYGIYRGVEMEPGKWYHVAASWDEKNLMLFLDGRLVGTRERMGDLVFGETFIVGGRRYRQFADGLMAEFRVSSVAGRTER